MVTWLFCLVAVLVGMAIGMLIGIFVVCVVEMRDGGAWSKGFFEGCEAKFLIDYLNREREEAKGRRSAEHGKNNASTVSP